MVEVPAGRFQAMKISYSGFVCGGNVSMLVWYADGVEVVKQVYCPESSSIVIELCEYTRGN
ncbi:MAG: hypothetical protein J5J06_09210 [Phycisphaerae bacterium]|nr:hypothetical protein [Phycisphaerae bacterium]